MDGARPTPLILRWETLAKRVFDALDRTRAVVLLTCSPLEVHGPHLAVQGFRAVVAPGFHGTPRHFLAIETACHAISRECVIRMVPTFSLILSRLNGGGAELGGVLGHLPGVDARPEVRRSLPVPTAPRIHASWIGFAIPSLGLACAVSAGRRGPHSPQIGASGKSSPRRDVRPSPRQAGEHRSRPQDGRSMPCLGRVVPPSSAPVVMPSCS